MTTTLCRHCDSPATVRLYGKYRNGREAIDYRCDEHRPTTSTGRRRGGRRGTRAAGILWL